MVGGFDTPINTFFGGLCINLDYTQEESGWQAESTPIHSWTWYTKLWMILHLFGWQIMTSCYNPNVLGWEID